MKNDILWINYVKAISIIMVYFVHCNQYYGINMGLINSFIHPFYVNAFYFISGYLFFRKQLSEPLLSQDKKTYFSIGGKSLVNNIFYRLLLPTIFFSVIEFFPSHLLRNHRFVWSTFMYKTIGGCTYWFTAALVVAELMLFLLLITRKKNIWFYFICSCGIFILGRYLVENNISIFESYPSLPWHYRHGMYAIIFLALGGLYWRYEFTINKLINKYIVALMLIVYVISLLIYPNEFRVLVSMLDVNYLGILLSVISTIVLIEFCKFLPYCRILNYIGNNTLGLYFMSGALPIVLSMLLNRFMAANYLGLSFVFFTSLAIGLITVSLINKFTPWLFNFKLILNKH